MLKLASAFIAPYLEYLKIAGGTILVAATIAFFGWVWWQHHQVVKLKKQNTALVAQNTTARKSIKTLKDNYLICWDTNKSNLKTIAQLTADRKKALDRLQILAKEKKVNKKTYDDLKKEIQRLSKDPKNDGPVAPVLKQTIKSIQENDK